MASEHVLTFTQRGECYTLRDFFEDHQRNLPKLIMVTQGYYGGVDIETFCAGQIIRVHTYTKQKRIIAKDANNRDISIPIDYPLKFKLIETSQKATFHGLKLKSGKGSKELALKEIMSEAQLPLQVELALPPGYTFDVGSRQERSSSFGVITLTGEYDETYLLANSIHSGYLDPNIALIPLYLKDVLVSTVDGIEKKTPDQFSRFVEGLDFAAKNFTYDLNVGNQDIAIYSPLSVKSNNEYDYIAPVELFKVSKKHKPREDHVYHDLGDSSTGLVSDVKGVISELKTTLSRPKRPAPVPAPKPTVPKRDPVLRRNSETSATIDENHKYVNDIGRAVVQPFEVHKKTEEVSVEEKPIEKLTIQELGQKLKALKLDKYVKAFSNEGIDGSLLVEFNEDILKDNFKLSAIESIKLMKFARTGHIPH
ncbi:uncharacterized protein LOC121377223 [Gigantopelta aegis]|uniref:uncharacterized protein LOC121377223 n=1 Tax=Gigantopelta aegis TaxID=1735272 RepID=UPI001B88BB52|nr:uncharacterized protein LOC121377223 [Gigantopelta aegis]